MDSSAGKDLTSVRGLPMGKKNLAAIRGKIGVVFQDSESQLFMPSVLEDVKFGPLNHGISPGGSCQAGTGSARGSGDVGSGRQSALS